MQNINQLLSKFEHNEFYLNRYINFIRSCQLANFGKILKTEKHHILPKSKYLFPEYADLMLFRWNRVDLTARQHYIAHWILSKVYLHKTQKASCLKAFYRMSSESCDCIRNITSTQFERSKEANRISMVINNPMHDPDTVEKMKLSTRKYYTTEVRKMISEKRKGVCNISEQGLERLSEIAKSQGLGKNKTPEQILNNRISRSNGKYITPFGEFYNPTEASNSMLNVGKISRSQIKTFCLTKANGFDFIPKTQM